MGLLDNKPKIFHRVNIWKWRLQIGGHLSPPRFVDRTTYNLALPLFQDKWRNFAYRFELYADRDNKLSNK